MKKLFSIITILSFMNIFSQSNETLINFPGYQNMIGKPFSIEQFNSEKGIQLNIEKLKGKATLINFWSTNCEPCIEEMPMLNELKKNLDGKANFVGITFSPKEKVKKFLTEHEFSFNLITDAEYNLFEKNKITRYPMTYIIDKDGNLQYVIGKVNSDNINMIKKILSEY